MRPDPDAHRAAMSQLADDYFAAECRRLGPIDGVAAPAPRRATPTAPPRAKRPPRDIRLDRSKL